MVANVEELQTQADEDRRVDGELYKLLTLGRGSWEEGSPAIERRVTHLVQRCMLRSVRFTATWNVLSRRCDICQQLQPSAQELISHRYTAHTGGSKLNPVPAVYTCLICSATSTRKYKLCMHIVRQHEHTNPPSSNNDAAPTPHTTHNKPYECPLCLKAYISKQYLQIHIGVHSGEKAYQCDICHKRFPQSYHLNRHKRLHTGEKPYGCDVCHKHFSRSDHLLQHKGIHTGVKPYKCDVCHKNFSRSYQLVQHKRVHTGVKPYKCDVCHKNFSHSSSLVKHQRVHTRVEPHQ